MILFVHDTSRVDDEPYPQLLRQMGFGGFPSLALLSADGEKLASPSAREVENFDATLAALQDWTILAAKDDRDELENARLFAAQLQLGKIEFAVARASAAKHLAALPAAHAARVRNELLLLETRDVLARAGKDRAAGHAELAAMAKAERIPTGSRSTTFWIGVMTHALDTEDAELLERGVTVFAAQFGERPGTEQILARYRVGLEAMRKK